MSGSSFSSCCTGNSWPLRPPGSPPPPIRWETRFSLLCYLPESTKAQSSEKNAYFKQLHTHVPSPSPLSHPWKKRADLSEKPEEQVLLSFLFY